MSKVSSGDSKNTLYCSFCGKSQHEVRKLIAGPTVFICDECVELCMDIIREENTSSLAKSRDGIPTPKEIRKVLSPRAGEENDEQKHALRDDDDQRPDVIGPQFGHVSYSAAVSAAWPSAITEHCAMTTDARAIGLVR